MDRPQGGIRQRLFAWAFARFSRGYEEFAAKYKQDLFSGLAGTVLEIGPGGGANLRYLRPDKVRWIGIEPNRFMEDYLRKEAARLGLGIELHAGTAEHLPVPDASVDAVISTLVLCCTASQEQALREILRVLRPGGRLLFLEHVAAPRGTRLRTAQNLVTPFWKQLGDGCQPNRETWVQLERAGFAGVDYRRITIPAFLVAPHIVGAATKRG
ncbi:MAG: class I SAM-dependent methyltransferase [Myxococcales bacterium]